MTVQADAASPKASVFLDRFVKLAHRVCADADACERGVSATVEELSALWDCSPRAAQETLRRLSRWGLVRWDPRPGRGHRSKLEIKVHPVFVYFDRACAAHASGQWAEAAFWLGEILRECPCIPEVPAMLADARRRLGLRPAAWADGAERAAP
ncbi:MAG: SgrR family transcriptional regulator [Firmicutes bacterium]|nr:SgrR family transcriptional regulator [Bacillota bacterium]